MRHKKTRSQSKKLCDKKKTAVSLFDMNYIDGRRPYAHIIIASEQVECLIILVSLDGCANDNFPYREQFSIVAWLSRYRNHLGQIPSLTKVIPDIHLFFYNAKSNAPTSGRGETAFCHFQSTILLSEVTLRDLDWQIVFHRFIFWLYSNLLAARNCDVGVEFSHALARLLWVHLFSIT